MQTTVPIIIRHFLSLPRGGWSGRVTGDLMANDQENTTEYCLVTIIIHWHLPASDSLLNDYFIDVTSCLPFNNGNGSKHGVEV